MTTPKPTSKTPNTSGWLAALIAALMGFWGGKATTPSQPAPSGPTKDTTVVGTHPTQDTTIKVLPSTDTTVIVVTPPTPPVTQPSTPATGVILKDDFTGYKTTADLQAVISPAIGGKGGGKILYNDGRNAQLASIDETVLYNGHHTMKYSQPGDSPNTPELWASLNTMNPHTWIKAVIRFQPGWTTIGTGQTYNDAGKLVGSSNAYKLLGWGYDDGKVYGSGRIEISNTTEYQNYWTISPKKDQSGTAGCSSHDQGQTNVRVNTEWTDGQWYTYFIEVDNTQKAGVTRFYMGKGSEKPTLRLVCTASMSNNTLVPGPVAVNLGMNYNQVRKVGQDLALNYGEWDVAAGEDPFGVK
jgi:hypothetical protein